MNLRNYLDGMRGDIPTPLSAAPGETGAAGLQNGNAGPEQNGRTVRGAAPGDLPRRAPIAMTYTPLQREPENTFAPMQALERGTLFPGLDLPLCNNYNAAELARTPMTETQALCFAAHELGLYLDTHPEDEEALRAYRTLRQAANEQTAEFSRRYYPLTTAQNTGSSARYVWVDDPWPWQRGASGRQ